MTRTDAGSGPPPFDDPFEGEDVEQRIYGTVIGTRSPTAASAIADDVGCDPKTARKYLEWFAELGIVTRHDGRPVTYERNDAYFEWRRVDELAAEHSLDELRERVNALSARIREYEEEYGAETPGEVDALALAESDADRDIDGIYRDLGEWATVRRERRRHERARRRRAESGERLPG